MQADIINSGFAEAHDTYNAISCASDGRIYYVLSSEKADVAAQIYSYDPASKAVKHLGDLTEACGEKGLKAVAQGKSHVRFVEADGKLYFATHLGYYSIIDGMEKPGVPPAGMKPYPGGHFLAYDMSTGKYESLAIAPRNEGIITFNMDTQRGRLYGLTWPTGRFIRYDIAKRELKDLGPVSEQGENGKGPTFRTICRSLAVDPADGSVYFTTSDGAIHQYRYDSETIGTVASDDLKKDYFGLYDPSSAGHMGYNWRQTFWYAPAKAIYGVHGNSGYLFRFDSAPRAVEVLDRITSEASQRSGMFDQFSYGYLGFTLGTGQPDDLLSDRRPGLPERPPRARQGIHRQGRIEGARRPAPDHLAHPHQPLHRSRPDFLRERPAAELREFHRRGQGRRRLRAFPRLRRSPRDHRSDPHSTGARTVRGCLGRREFRAARVPSVPGGAAELTPPR